MLRKLFFLCTVQPKGKKKGKGKGKGKGKAAAAVIDGISTDDMTREQVHMCVWGKSECVCIYAQGIFPFLRCWKHFQFVKNIYNNNVYSQ